MMVAVTGASGLVGQSLVEHLLGAGMKLTAIVRRQGIRFPEGVIVREADILDPFSLKDALQGVDTVIHAAGLVSFNPRRRDEIFRVNVEGTRTVVNTCLKEGIPHFIQISSVSALGRKLNEPVSERDPWTGQFANAYATSKYLAELEVYRGAEEGLIVGLVNPSVILSGAPLHRSSAALFDYAWKERPFYTDGLLNYVDVRDVADAVINLVRQPQPGERFTLSAGSIRYLEFFTRLARQWKKRPPHIRIPSRLVSWFGVAEEIRCRLLHTEPVVTRDSAAMTVRNFQYNVSKARQMLGMRFRDLDDTIAWCCSEYVQHVNGNK